MIVAGATASMPLSVTCHCHSNDDLVPAVQPSHSFTVFSSRSLSSKDLPPLDVSAAKVLYSSTDVVEIANECASPSLSVLSESSGTMSVDSPQHIAHRTVPNSPETRPKLRQTRTIPSASSVPVSPVHRRSTSCSTVRSGNASRRSSMQSHRPSAAPTPLSPSAASRRSLEKRENLIALHREACRIFQTDDASSLTKPDTQVLWAPPPAYPGYFSPHGGNIPSEVGSPAASPVTRPQSDRFLDRNSLEVGLSDARLGSQFSAADSEPRTSTTVIDWTSPSTRKREYAKIDRANRGIRGLWRRVAPKWCQPVDRRTPFFEEGKNGKANYEGSVRRFRMDIPEDPSFETGADKPQRPFGWRGKRAATEECLTNGSRQGRRPCVGRMKSWAV